ncbi:nucleoredoxin-like protein 1 [Alligator mississippiensis]|uniref:nucleoredoxin-like protein 1 n=1 Tax=Alligator mississippiensis TaxID=8496 RepID=UPI0028773FF2|nr:nucleoredoxin-like protein 1 [Alligator mississippiensis]
MASLFTGKILIVNNKDCDELDTEHELSRRLENKVMLLYFGSGECPRCQEFSPVLKDFFVRLTDEFYVERASQLVLVYVSQDETEEKQEKFLKTMPKRWLSLPFQDEFKRELESMFVVCDTPIVVVLKPNGEVISGNAVEEIEHLGPACFKNWEEAADLINRNFLLAEDFDDMSLRSITDPIRRLKYKLDKKMKKEERENEEEDAMS